MDSSVKNYSTNQLSDWIHLIFRGECTTTKLDCDDQPDEYRTEFEKYHMISGSVAILEFKFKNIEKLAKLCEETIEEEQENTVGLIVTSPRVVEALCKTLDLYSDSMTLRKFNPELVFVVGPKTGKECERKLGISINQLSGNSGNASDLSSYVSKICKPSRFTLIYPKGSLAKTTILDALALESHIKIKTIEVYETNAIDDIHGSILDGIENIRSSIDKPKNLNLIFFSPSGVNGFAKIDRNELRQSICKMLSVENIKIKYSGIGKTTEMALINNGLDVFCVSSKPNPSSLVENLIHKLQSTSE